MYVCCMIAEGALSKMKTTYGTPVQYLLRLGEEAYPLNDVLGKKLSLTWLHEIHCIVCGRKTSKSFGQGFCFPCFRDSPENSDCILRPELCRGHLGEGRNPEWELENHVQPHAVYLAKSSDIKIGITRSTQVPTRWIDQGASAALIIAKTPNRYEAGMIEVAAKQFLTDKTHWQKMLKGERTDRNITEVRDSLQEKIASDYWVQNEEILDIQYPVLRYPQKVVSMGFDKNPEISGILTGIKGQYLILDDQNVINLRSYSGYTIRAGWDELSQ